MLWRGILPLTIVLIFILVLVVLVLVFILVLVILVLVFVLVHRTELSWNGKSPEPKSIAKVGDSLKVKILSIDRDNKKIAASVREVKGDPWQTLDIERGDVIEAVVTNKTNFGFFLKIADGIEGLLHNNDLAWNRLDRDALKDSLSVGDTVRVVLLEIDKEKRKMTFSIKHLDSEQ